MKDIPILFGSEMIRALLANRKTRSRRLSKQWLKVKRGDRLWCRETLYRPDGDPWLYRADDQPVMVAKEDETAMVVWAHHKEQDVCVSIHMPRWASRITLEATEDAREERLWDLTEGEARAEGITPPRGTSAEAFNYRKAFGGLWASLHKDAPWKENPTVIRLAFRKVDQRP